MQVIDARFKITSGSNRSEIIYDKTESSLGLDPKTPMLNNKLKINCRAEDLTLIKDNNDNIYLILNSEKDKYTELNLITDIPDRQYTIKNWQLDLEKVECSKNSFYNFKVNNNDKPLLKLAKQILNDLIPEDLSPLEIVKYLNLNAIKDKNFFDLIEHIRNNDLKSEAFFELMQIIGKNIRITIKD